MTSVSLRDRMIKEMEIRGLDEKTKKAYLASMEAFNAYFKRSPDQLELDDLKDYQLYLLKGKGLAPNSVNRHMSGIKFFFMHVLDRYWYTIALPRVRVPQKDPTILSEAEIASLINSVHNVRYKAIIMVMYSAGLRNEEVRNLRTTDIDSKRMVINVRNGKGHRDGQTILAELTLKCLRTYWRLFRRHDKVKSDILFTPTKNSHSGKLDKTLSHTALGHILEVAAKAAGIKKKLPRTSCDIPLQFI